MTNNIIIKYLFNQQKLNACQEIWLAFFSEFDFEIKHIKGKKKKIVDALSRKFNMTHATSTRNYQSDMIDRIIFRI